jgi:hypothetical protein
MKSFTKQLKAFNISELENISFGSLEGEKDDRLSDSFFITSSIRNLLGNKYNYILSPKGGGKSAIFRSLKEKLISPQNIFDYDKYSIIDINTAFGFDDDYLPSELFKEEDNRRNYTFSWAIFLLSHLINDIKNNQQHKQGYDEFINKIKKIQDFKDKFNLYDFGDLLSQLSIGLTFNVGGQPIDVKPKLTVDKKYEKLILNDIFKLIDNFYNQNNITALILIDRLDNFVRKESYAIQKNYIQGLIDCIEEISNFKNIGSILFIRTDLFYAFDIDFEYDKLKERTQDLLWEDGETISFIVYRLLANPYIKENYREYFDHIFKGTEGDHGINKKKSIWQKICFWKKQKNEEIDLKRTIDYAAAEKFLRLFFPETIENFDNKKFCLWIFEFLVDAHSFVNPRLLIYFFNELFKEQFAFNSKVIIESKKDKEAKKLNELFYFELFTQEIFPKVYKKVQNDELRNIYKILKEKDYQTIFKEINKVTAVRKIFNYGDINIKKMNISKDEYERLLKYLILLGYFKEVEKNKYEIPNLYHCEMTLQTIN